MGMRTYFGVHFFESKFDSLDGKTKVAFVEQSGAEKPFTVEVDSSGLRFKGDSPNICTERDLQEYARLVSDAWAQHRKLAPKIHTSLSGH